MKETGCREFTVIEIDYGWNNDEWNATQLKGRAVWAVDGHQITHAAHAARDAKDALVAGGPRGQAAKHNNAGSGEVGKSCSLILLKNPRACIILTPLADNPVSGQSL